MIHRIGRLMDQFATPAGFLSASKGDIMRAWGRVFPGRTKGLGNKLWKVFDRVNAIYKGLDIGDVRVEPEKEAEACDAREVRMITLKELQTVVSFMDLCDIEAINLLEITGFLGAVRMRQGEKPDAPTEATNAANP
jgi:hypothetical protein